MKTFETAIIKKVYLGFEDDRYPHMLTFKIWLKAKSGRWTACFGHGSCLGINYNRYPWDGDRRDEYKGWNGMSEYLMRIFDLVGVNSIDKMEGKRVTVKVESGSAPVKAIGNAKGTKWIDIYEIFDEINMKLNGRIIR